MHGPTQTHWEVWSASTYTQGWNSSRGIPFLFLVDSFFLSMADLFVLPHDDTRVQLNIVCQCYEIVTVTVVV